MTLPPRPRRIKSIPPYLMHRDGVQPGVGPVDEGLGLQLLLGWGKRLVVAAAAAGPSRGPGAVAWGLFVLSIGGVRLSSLRGGGSRHTSTHKPPKKLTPPHPLPPSSSDAARPPSRHLRPRRPGRGRGRWPSRGARRECRCGRVVGLSGGRCVFYNWVMVWSCDENGKDGVLFGWLLGYYMGVCLGVGCLVLLGV